MHKYEESRDRESTLELIYSDSAPAYLATQKCSVVSPSPLIQSESYKRLVDH